MACRNAYRTKKKSAEAAEVKIIEPAAIQATPIKAEKKVRMLFGVDSNTNADDMLQNHINMFEWVKRNKIYPNFWGRNIMGDNCLTRTEANFIHACGCKIAPICSFSGEKKTAAQGEALAEKLDEIAEGLGIPSGCAIFLDISENDSVSTEFMYGYAKALINEGYIPAFKANTDAAYSFDKEFSRGLQTEGVIFGKCLVWAVAPTIPEYDKITTTHLIHPDKWMPYAPSGITRGDIAIWQYGRDCHPIHDDEGKKTTFNLNVVKDEKIIVDKMF